VRLVRGQIDKLREQRRRILKDLDAEIMRLERMLP
jgi:hypothetical protein